MIDQITEAIQVPVDRRRDKWNTVQTPPDSTQLSKERKSAFVTRGSLEDIGQSIRPVVEGVYLCDELK